MEFQYEYAGKAYPVHIRKEGGLYRTNVGESEHEVVCKEIKPGFLMLRIDGRPVKVCVATEGNHRHIFLNGMVYRFTRSEGRKRKSEGYEELSPEISSPISGKVVKVGVNGGEAVKTGDVLMVIEAMKMEYQIKAPFDGSIKDVKPSVGDQVEIGAVLVEMVKEV